MATAEQVLAVARAEVGYREAPVNRTKYGRAYGSDGFAWCLTYCWWVVNQVPGGAGLLPKSAYTPYAYDWFKANGRAFATPQPGDLAFFNWRNNTRAWPLPQHVGIVEAINPDGSLTLIEGNTQQGTTGNQSDGGGVWRRTRARTPYVVGYGRPAYTATPAATSPREGFLMALNDQQQADLLGMVNAIYAQMSGDEDGPGPDGWGWPSARHDGGPELTVVDLLRHVDREVNSRLGLEGRPGPDSDTLFGHLLSLRADLRSLGGDVVGRLAKLAQTGGLPTVVAEADPATLAAVAKAVADEQDRRQRSRLAA